MVQNGKVKIYLADIRPLFDETMQKKALAQLDEVRRQKALSCRQTKQRAASLTAGLLAEEAKRRNGFDGCPVCYTKNGQPYLFIQDGRRAFLSLSHSGDYAVCAFSDCPVGVDLQQRTKIRRSVLQKFYLQEQLEAWKKQFDKKEELFLSEAETERFLREWTVKESYVKLTGTGLSRDLRALMVDWNQNRVEEADRPGWGSRFCEYPVLEDYFLSACSCPEEVGWFLRGYCPGKP